MPNDDWRFSPPDPRPALTETKQRFCGSAKDIINSAGFIQQLLP